MTIDTSDPIVVFVGFIVVYLLFYVNPLYRKVKRDETKFKI